MLRRLIGLAGYVPFSSDALVTPVTFRVRGRKFRGLLSDLAAAETGSRELSGEWVVGKRLWKRLQAEWRAAQDTKSKSGGAPERPKRKELVTLFLHGGMPLLVFSRRTLIFFQGRIICSARQHIDYSRSNCPNT